MRASIERGHQQFGSGYLKATGSTGLISAATCRLCFFLQRSWCKIGRFKQLTMLPARAESSRVMLTVDDLLDNEPELDVGSSRRSNQHVEGFLLADTLASPE